MDTTIRKPKTIAELLPGLSGIISKDAMQTLTAQKKPPRKTIANVRTDEKVIKQPMTLAEMRGDLQALITKSPKRSTQMTASQKKRWNSSVKVDKKTTSITASGKHTSARKVLNFQLPKPRPPKNTMMPNSRMTMNSETAQFPKPELKVKKSFYVQAKTNVRISGVYQIPETPVYTKPTKSGMTLANKENVANQAPLNRRTIAEQQLTKTNVNKKLAATPKSALRQRVLVLNVIPDTPLSNESWKSSCDASFLQNEKDIDCIEEKTNVLLREQTFEDITEESPPVSTPFKDYRNVTEFFNNSSVNDSANDNTIMIFDQQNKSKQNGKKDDSAIVSLCELLNKATVSNTEQPTSELEDLLKFEQQTENNIKIIESGIRSLENIKESELKSLQYVRKLIQEKQEKETRISESEKDKAVIETTKDLKEQSLKSCSITIKSPSFKIPKKNRCIGKKVVHKSMGDCALNMYMQMKEHMPFLSTPSAKMRTKVPDTPTITSHNLQTQLDKLYTES